MAQLLDVEKFILGMKCSTVLEACLIQRHKLLLLLSSACFNKHHEYLWAIFPSVDMEIIPTLFLLGLL